MSNSLRDGSKTVDLLRRARHRVTSTADRSTTVAQTVVSGSFIYRWLTAEPEPEVIVIDLRETWTVGPILSIIDRVVGDLTQGAQMSRFVGGARSVATAFRKQPINIVSLGGSVGALGILFVGGLTQSLSVVSVAFAILIALGGMVGLGSQRTLNDIQETKAAQLLISAFEPPEPPSTVRSETTNTKHESTAEETESDTTDD